MGRKKGKSSKVSYRDAHGRFTSREKATKISYRGITRDFKADSNSIDARIERTLKAREKSGRKSQAKFFGRQLEAEHKPYSGSETTSETITAPENFGEKLRNSLMEDANKISSKVDRFNAPFEVSEKLLKSGISEEMQMEYYNVMVRANEEAKKINIASDGLLNIGFSQRLDNITVDQFIRRLEAAENVLSGDYMNSLAEKYKSDYVEAFFGIIDEETYEDLKNTVNSVDALTFLSLLKSRKMDMFAYAIDSVLTDFGIEQVTGEANAMITAIKEYTA